MSKILTFGVYDYFHLGHLRLFKQCKNYGDYLIVAVQDGDYIKKYKPDSKILYTTAERVEMLESLRIVDKVVVYESVEPKFLESVDFDMRRQKPLAMRSPTSLLPVPTSVHTPSWDAAVWCCKTLVFRMVHLWETVFC